MPLLATGRSIPQMLAAALAARVRDLADVYRRYALVEQLAPGAALTEGFTWLIAATGIGIAAGSPAGGLAVDLAAARAAFLAAAAAALLAASIALMGRRWLHSPVGASAGPPPVIAEIAT